MRVTPVVGRCPQAFGEYPWKADSGHPTLGERHRSTRSLSLLAAHMSFTLASLKDYTTTHHAGEAL
jgi:hypothetical protein